MQRSFTLSGLAALAVLLVSCGSGSESPFSSSPATSSSAGSSSESGSAFTSSDSLGMDPSSSGTSSSSASQTDMGASSISQALAGEEGQSWTIEGTVTEILYSSRGSIAQIWVFDGTGGIDLYNESGLPDVAIGNGIVVLGTYSVYKNTPELEDATILSNDGMTSLTLDDSWIVDSTVTDIKELADSPVGQIFRVQAIIGKDDNYGTYYLNEVVGDESLQAYSQSSYSEYAFLDQYVGEDVTIVFQVGTPKVSNGNEITRVMPLYVESVITKEDEQAEVDASVKEGLRKANLVFFGPGKITLPGTSQSLEGATFTYGVSDEAAAVVTEREDGDYQVDVLGTAGFTIKATLTYGSFAATDQDQVEIREKPTFSANDTIENLRQEATTGETVTIVGVVVGGVFGNGNDGYRYNDYYVADSSGTIEVYLTADQAGKFALEKGEQVALTGTWDIYEGAANTKSVEGATVIWHDSATNDLPLTIPSRDFSWMIDYQVDSQDNRSGDVFYMETIVKKVETTYGTAYYAFSPDATSFDTSDKTAAKNIYKASGADLSYLDPWLDGKVTVLMGIHDKKAGYDDNGEAENATGGYYRYDIIPGYFALD